MLLVDVSESFYYFNRRRLYYWGRRRWIYNIPQNEAGHHRAGHLNDEPNNDIRMEMNDFEDIEAE
uniref:Uncharacterized protein n=1 Tax=Ciona intestinalis TaxID=7719 RepID=H2XW52_CIOIN